MRTRVGAGDAMLDPLRGGVRDRNPKRHIEFQLAGNNRMDAVRAATRDHVGENRSRIPPEALTSRDVAQVELHLCRWAQSPRSGLQRPWDRPARAVGVAVVCAESCRALT